MHCRYNTDKNSKRNDQSSKFERSGMKDYKAHRIHPAHLLVGFLFGFIDYDGAVADDTVNTTLRILGQESLFRWSMALFWGYFLFLAAWRYVGVFPRIPRLLLVTCALIVGLYAVSATRLFIAGGGYNSFFVFEYRNLSLFAIVAIAVVNRNARIGLASFLIGWIVMCGLRGWVNIGRLFLGARQFQESLGVYFTSFDGTLLSQESVCAVLSLGLARSMLPRGNRTIRIVCHALMLGMVVDNLGSFRRHVYVRLLCMISFAALLVSSRRKVVSIVTALAVTGAMALIIVGIFGTENVAERVASYRVKDFSKTMDSSNEFYLNSWDLQLSLAPRKPLLGYGLRSPLLNYNVDGVDIPIHTGFHTLWIREGLLGLAIQILVFVIIPVTFFINVRRAKATAGTLIIGALLGFAMFEGLFPFKDAIIGNIKACVAIGLTLGLAIKRIEECKRNMTWIRKSPGDQLELF
jgi:hypothetical protein